MSISCLFYGEEYNKHAGKLCNVQLILFTKQLSLDHKVRKPVASIHIHNTYNVTPIHNVESLLS